MSKTPNFSNAFDLSSLVKPKVETPAELPGFEVTAENLQGELLAQSNTKVVVIAMYSPRHPDSISTLMTLAQMAQADNQSWLLARVDIETQPQVAQALQTKSLPYAVAVIKGQPIPLFDGAYPQEQIRKVIDKLLSVAAEQGIGSAPQERIEPEEEEAIAALERGDLDGAEQAYQRLVERRPSDHFGKLGLAQVHLLKRTQGLDPAIVRAKADQSPSDVAAAMQCADIEVVHGAIESAFERLLRLLPQLSGDQKTAVKDRLIELFSLVDPADPILIKARTQLANYLF